MVNDWTWATDALAPHVRGRTLDLEGVAAAPVPKTERIERGTAVTGHVLDHIDTASVDAVVSVGATLRGGDPVGCVSEWRRVLRDGGSLALILPQAGDPERGGYSSWATPQSMVSLLRLTGGFCVETLEVLRDGVAYLLVARRSAIAEVREPLGVLGPAIARGATQDPAVRAELYFQIGTILLQADDSQRAADCFAELLRIEPDSREGLFGLGMAHARLEQWPLAVTVLQRAAAADPENGQIQHWLELASEKLAAPVPVPSPAEPARAATLSTPR